MKEAYADVKNTIKNGVIPATVTPLTPDYGLAEDDLYDHIDHLSSVDGIVAVIANAHSGESKMTPMDVKEDVIRVHREAAGDDALVFSGISGESTTQAIKQAKRAEEAGADALMPVPIDVYSHGDPNIILDHYKGIAEAVDVPLIAFQFGNYGDIALPIAAYVELCKLDEVVALKDATFDPVRYEQTVRAVEPVRDQFTLMTGDDTFLYHSYLLGAETALISYANLIPEMHVEKLRAVHDGDLERAQELRSEMLDLTNFLYGDPPGRYRVRLKEALHLMGTFDHATVRPPQQGMDPERRDELRTILQDLGCL
ncbi:dihydrodipicolinate synthase family protein [Natrinema halophilum]|uniref:Dihydrodipicolinate synthase family protein n=1 Tax=Natrinema halophilum TaxID=1699371 RepID=A0A7D5GP39_9EURY|nr:dihydrodipicolinate synthase family protein [Natrinema halophilum]QLG49993.1 dihydrodipicolinate synthase family protein [Natrinema halophilum]